MKIHNKIRYVHKFTRLYNVSIWNEFIKRKDKINYMDKRTKKNNISMNKLKTCLL